LEDEENVNMEQRWKQATRGKQKYSGKSLSQFNICYRKSQMDWAVIKSDLRGYRPPKNHLRHCTAITSAV